MSESLSGSDPPQERKRSLGSALRLLFPVVVTVVAFATVIDAGELGRAVASASIALVVACFLVACLDLVVMGLKWALLLRAYSIRVPPVVPVAAYFQSEIFSLFLPSILGTDAFRAWFFQRRGFQLGPTVSSIVVERTIGLVSSVAVGCLLAPFAVKALTGRSEAWWFPAGVIVWGLLWIGVPYVSSRAGVAPRWRVWRLLPRGAAVASIRFLRSLATIKGHTSTVSLYYALSQLEKTLYGVVIWLAAQAVHLTDVSLLAVVAATPVVAFLERIPISVRAIGIREGLYVVLLAPFGVAATTALSVALVVRFAELLRAGLGLVWWTAHGRVRPAVVSAPSEERQSRHATASDRP